jgi:DNA-binding transcriptional LysR family regulator
MAVSAVFLDRVVNLLEEGMDIGIRIGALADSEMRAIGVGHVRRVVCASPAYLKAHGIPRTPADLAKHLVVASTATSPSAAWRFMSGKQAVSVNVRPRLTVTNNEAAIVAALQGFGATRLLSYQVAEHVAAGRLKVVLSDYEPARLPIHVLHREGRQPPAKVRTFIDLLVERLRSDRALN